MAPGLNVLRAVFRFQEFTRSTLRRDIKDFIDDVLAEEGDVVSTVITRFDIIRHHIKCDKSYWKLINVETPSSNLQPHEKYFGEITKYSISLNSSGFTALMFPSEFPWYLIFGDGKSTLMFWHTLYYKLDDDSTWVIQSLPLIYYANYAKDWTLRAYYPHMYKFMKTHLESSLNVASHLIM